MVTQEPCLQELAGIRGECIVYERQGLTLHYAAPGCLCAKPRKTEVGSEG